MSENVEIVRDAFEAINAVRREADEFIEAGEHVVTPMTSYHRGRDGIELRARLAMVWTFHNEAITRVTYYQERDAAFEAAGLSE